MAKLWEVTKLVRSKNAGPFVLTFDIMFDDPDVYEKVRDSGALNKKLVAGDVQAERGGCALL